jgi:alkylation response protein AidB-like acyl-CoA dehydrogenase
MFHLSRPVKRVLFVTISMRFAFDDDQEALRASARRFLESHAAPAAVRAEIERDRGGDPDLWRRVGRELGWTSLIIPEAYGGAGLGWIELAAVLEEMGRAVLPSPFFSTVCLATPAILLAGSESQKQDDLPGIAAGETIATLAYDGIAVPAIARKDAGADEWVIDGSIPHVIDGDRADLLIVPARTGESINLFLVPGATPGVARRALPTMDRTRRIASIELGGVRLPPSAILGDEGGGATILERTIDLACVALAAEQVGGAERCLDLSVDYAKTRVQFGRPIGSFQAIKHRCADLLVDVESARSAAYHAAWCAATGDPDLPLAAATAKAICSEAYFRCAAETIQIHGGIGFTWEHEAHVHFKRARASEAFLGAPSFHRERVARRLGL